MVSVFNLIFLSKKVNLSTENPATDFKEDDQIISFVCSVCFLCVSASGSNPNGHDISFRELQRPENCRDQRTAETRELQRPENCKTSVEVL
jgi:hypothetical protein